MVLESVLRIRDILVRIRIRGSVPLTNGYGSWYIRQWPWRWQLKILSFSCLLRYYLHHFSKIESHKEVTKQWELWFSLLFSLDYRRIRSRIHLVLIDPDPGGPKTCGSGSGSATLVRILFLQKLVRPIFRWRGIRGATLS
jgi:hypothetical protein